MNTMPTSVSQELLDVVDAQDRVVGVRTRGDIHRMGLMHRSVHILVFNRNDELFIQKRSMSKDNNPGLWDSSAAGHLDSGEDYSDCAIRELAEELGVVVAAPLEILFRLSASEHTGMEHCTVYRCMNDGPFQLQEEEIDEGTWVACSEMDRRVSEQDSNLTSILRLIWEKFRRNF
jgi:isopentenyl-diphosphate delta-isomerase type 1